MEDRLAVLKETTLGILSNDNNYRKLCEERLEEFRKEPNSLVLGLLKLLQTLTDVDHRKLSATLLKRYLAVMFSAETCVWKDLNEETEGIVKEQLLKSLEAETDPKAARIISLVVAELAATINNSDKEWNELDPFLYKLVTGGSELQRTMAYLTMNYVFGYIHERYETHAAELATLFATTLTKDTLSVKIVSIDALCHLVVNIIYSRAEPFIELLPYVINTVQEVVKTGNEDMLKSVLDSLNFVADDQPKYFVKGFDSVYQLLLEITAKACEAGPENLEDNKIPQLAIEIVISIIERTPSLLKKKAPETYLLPLLKVLTLLMCAINPEVEKEWLNPDPTIFFTGGDEDDIIIFAKRAIDRALSCAKRRQNKLELNLLSPILLECFNNDKDWRVKHAGFLGASLIGEYIEDATKIENLVTIMIDHMTHPHPKIRYAAIKCIGQIALDCSEFPEAFHGKIMPALFNSLNDPIARVQRCVCSSLSYFIDKMEINIVDKYTTPLMLKLEEVLKTAGAIVQECIMGVIGSIAEATPTNFKVNYYDHIMPFLIRVMKECKDYKLKKLRGSVIECITTIAKVVGKEKFKTHAKEVIESMYNIQENELESQDPQKYSLLTAWEKLCLVLKEDLVPYIELLFPSLLKLAVSIPGITISTMKQSTLELEQAAKELTATDLPSIEERRRMVQFTTTGIEEKECAITMLGVMVDELGGYLDKYVENISGIVLNILRYSGVEDLRIAAAATLKGLIKAIKEPKTISFPEGYLGTAARTYLEVLMIAALDEYEPDPLVAEVTAMSEVLETAGRCLDQAGIMKVYETAMKLIKDSEERNQMSDDDEVEDEDETELENELQTDISQVITILFKTHPEESMFLVDLLYPAFLSELLKPEANNQHKRIGVYIVVDIVEYLGYAKIPKIYPQFVDAILAYSNHDDTFIRQACLYGIGVIAMTAGEFYPNVAENCYMALKQALDRQPPSNVDERRWKVAQDNGISSLGKMIKLQASIFPDVKQVVGYWLDKMPLEKDKVEGLIQNEFLADLVLNNTALVLGENGENFELVMDIFVDVLDTKQVNDEITMKISKGLNILIAVPALKDKFTKYGADLVEEQRESLERCFKLAQSS